MPYPMPHVCPVCSGEMQASRLTCTHCASAIEGTFTIDRLSQLSETQRAFVVSFLRNRGNIKEMEKEYSISYPTVRAKLDEIIAALGETPSPEHPARKEVLAMLSRNEISPDEAMQLLQKSK